MEYRRFGRTNHQSSVLIFGAAGLGQVTQEVADESIALARQAGINHFDTAASYGHAEQVMGPSMRHRAADEFLATKTTERTAEQAWRELNESFEKLQVSHADLWQVHAVCDPEELEKVFAPGGAIEAFERARDEGLVSFVGITGHTEQAPYVHTEALRRFDFDAVLTPLNYVLYRDDAFRQGFEELSELVTSRDVGLRTIKAIARRPWREGEQKYATWYRPFDEQTEITAAISWVLNKFDYVTGIATAGETTLLPLAIEAEASRVSVEKAETLLNSVNDYSTIFVD